MVHPGVGPVGHTLPEFLGPADCELINFGTGGLGQSRLVDLDFLIGDSNHFGGSSPKHLGRWNLGFGMSADVFIAGG